MRQVLRTLFSRFFIGPIKNENILNREKFSCPQIRGISAIGLKRQWFIHWDEQMLKLTYR